MPTLLPLQRAALQDLGVWQKQAHCSSYSLPPALQRLCILSPGPSSHCLAVSTMQRCGQAALEGLCTLLRWLLARAPSLQQSGSRVPLKFAPVLRFGSWRRLSFAAVLRFRSWRCSLAILPGNQQVALQDLRSWTPKHPSLRERALAAPNGWRLALQVQSTWLPRSLPGAHSVSAPPEAPSATGPSAPAASTCSEGIASHCLQDAPRGQGPSPLAPPSRCRDAPAASSWYRVCLQPCWQAALPTLCIGRQQPALQDPSAAAAPLLWQAGLQGSGIWLHLLRCWQAGLQELGTWSCWRQSHCPSAPSVPRCWEGALQKLDTGLLWTHSPAPSWPRLPWRRQALIPSLRTEPAPPASHHPSLSRLRAWMQAAPQSRLPAQKIEQVASPTPGSANH
mmetsp:Transcript_114053/g.254553  ORF Transcript_114053/g.254553 Transcript_114053/m.254553 type:complete len:393 (+) Transcript_114053:589-1767(+)